MIGFYVTLLYGGRQPQAMGQVSNISGISLSLSPPQLVVEVGYMKPYTQFLLQPDQNIEQAD